MPAPDSEPGRSSDRQEWFATTHWSVVLAARDPGSSQAAAALEKLCRAYWYPIYAYVRRRGYGEQDAQDLAQGFFTRLVEKNYLKTVGRQKGKFRSFLLAALNHFLSDEWAARGRKNAAEVISSSRSTPTPPKSGTDRSQRTN